MASLQPIALKGIYWNIKEKQHNIEFLSKVLEEKVNTGMRQYYIKTYEVGKENQNWAKTEKIRAVSVTS